MEDFFIADLVVEWQVSDSWRLFGRAENLFDESYESTFGYPALGRAGYIGARYAF
jgi:vitamin B12 transporter